MPSQEQVGFFRRQRIGDVGEELQRQFGVEQRVVYLHPRQRGLLILLDEMVIGVFREGQRTQVQRVNSGEVEQIQVRGVLCEQLQVVLDDVVADQV